jgi:anti-anti-sigma factor
MTSPANSGGDSVGSRRQAVAIDLELGESAEGRPVLAARAIARPAPPSSRRSRRTARRPEMREIRREASLYLRGDIDLIATPRLREEIAEAVLEARSDVVLDCADMTGIDLSALHHLTDLQALLRVEGRELRIAGVSADAARTIAMLGFTAALQVEGFVPTVPVPAVGGG